MALLSLGKNLPLDKQREGDENKNGEVRRIQASKSV